MTFATAFKISGVCLLALAAEVLAAYFLFSNYAYDLAQTGTYTIREAYTEGLTGPIASAARVFYVLVGVTAAAALLAPLIAAASLPFARDRVGSGKPEESGPLPPARPGRSF
jgi:hypothetical protein